MTTSDQLPPPDVWAFEAIRAACLRAAQTAYDDAGIQGLCAEGRWECAVAAIRALDLRRLLEIRAAHADVTPAAAGRPVP